MIFDWKRCDEVIRQDFRYKRPVSGAIGSWVTKAQWIEAEEEKKTGETIEHSKTVPIRAQK